MKKTKVLLVEDYVGMQKSLSDFVKIVYGKEAVVLIAATLIEAEAHFNKHADDLDFILMDTSLGKGVTTFELTKRISQTFKRPIITTSTDKEYREKMLKIGCTHECNKSDLLDFLERQVL